MGRISLQFGPWIGIVTAVIFGLSFLIPGFLPPMEPSLTPGQVAAYFSTHANSIRFGMILMMVSGCTMLFFTAVIAAQLRRVEKTHPIWTYAQLLAGGGASVIIVIGAMLMSAATFRPERPVEITHALYDLAWIMVIMPGTPAVFQNLSIGFAILSDKAKTPVFPRWFGFFNIWTGLLYSPGALLTFFKSGPFAWNGLLSFWMEAVTFGIWFIVMFIMLQKAHKGMRHPSTIDETL